MKAETAFWWSSLAKYLRFFFADAPFYLLIFFLPTQLGKHFWPLWSSVYGQRIDYLSPTLYVTDILVGLLFVFSLIKKELTVNGKFLVVILLLSFSVFLSKNPFVGWYYLLKFSEMSFVGWYVFHTLQGKNMLLQRVVFIFSASIIFESILALVQFFSHRSIGGLFYFLGERTFTSQTPGIANASIHGTLVLRPYGTFSHPNVLAAFLLLGMVVVWYVCHSLQVPTSLRSEKFDRRSEGKKLLAKKQPYPLLRFVRKERPSLLAVTTFLLGGLGLLFTLSRTTIFLGTAILVFALFRRFYRKTFFIIPFIILGFFLFPTLFYRFAPGTFLESAAQRLQLFSAAWNMFVHSPIFGVGLGNFIPSLPSSILLQPVHNIFVLWIVETGLIGVGIMTFFILSVGKRLFVKWQRANEREKQVLFPLVLLVMSIGYLGMFDHYFLTLQQGQLLLAFVTGLVFARINK